MSGEYAGYILAAYALVALGVGGLAVWLAWQRRALARATAELEAQGVRRRSAR